jgi:hypothetical protein
MVGRVLAAALIAVGLCIGARAEESTSPALYFETSESVQFWWTELADFEDRPKAWDGIVSPEFSASMRVVAGAFEATAEVGALADRFDHFGAFDADSLRAFISVGWNRGDWSYALEWEGFDVYAPGFDTFYVGFDTYDVYVAKRFTANVVPDLPPGQLTASLTAGYVDATYAPLDVRFASLELEWVQSDGGRFSLALAPKFELDLYPHFSARQRNDAILSLRLAPSYAIGEHITITLEGKASFTFSTLETKTGEKWELTPILRLQAAL